MNIYQRIFQRTMTIVSLCSFLVIANVTHAESKTITMKGSTTVLPIAQSTAEAFMQENPDVNISVQGGGSGVGIASIMDGTCDIGNASRPIKESELEDAVRRGKNIKANVVAMDGIAVIVHPSNPVKALTKKQLKDIYTGKISDWSVLGGSGEIVVISRDTSSGTFEAFSELALDKAKVRPDALMQASNQAVAQTVMRTPQAIGYVGLGFLSYSVKALSINGVVASKETVLNGTYPIGRPLFMYTQGKPTGPMKEYLDFVLSPKGQVLVEEAGYVGLR